MLQVDRQDFTGRWRRVLVPARSCDGDADHPLLPLGNPFALSVRRRLKRLPPLFQAALPNIRQAERSEIGVCDNAGIRSLPGADVHIDNCLHIRLSRPAHNDLTRDELNHDR